MPLTLEDINKVKQKSRGEARKPGPHEALRSLWKHMEQLRNPDLQLVPISALAAGDVVVSDVPCRLYALYLKKPDDSILDAFFKGCDHAVACAAEGEVAVKLVGVGGGGREYCVVFHDGLPLAVGLTIASHTTADGVVASAAADAPVGFAIVGAA